MDQNYVKINSTSFNMNKLIILLNLSGSYKGGAQRRYINLFKHLQNTRDDYFLLMNKSLFDACMQDGIFKSEKNILVQRVLFETKNKNTVSVVQNEKTIESTRQKKQSTIITQLGSFKYFVKLLIAWMDYTIKLYLLVKEYNFKVLYAVFTGGIWSWQLARMLHLKIIYSYNDSNISMVSKSLMDFFSSEYWPLKYADKVDFLSNDILKSLRQKIGYFDEERALITPNSFIDYARFYPTYPKKTRIAFCSRLTKFKNPDMLIEAIRILKKRGITNFEVAIIGEGILLNALKEDAKEQKLSNVIFYGGMSNPEEILSRSSIFISIQSDNNYPSQSLIEAMACENAIIASDVGETRLLVTEDEGILILLNPVSLADAIEFLIKNPDEGDRLGKSARKKVLKEQTIERFVEYFLKITQ